MTIQITGLTTAHAAAGNPVHRFCIDGVAFRAYGFCGYLRIEQRVVGTRRSCWTKLIYGPRYQAIFNALPTITN